MDITGIELHDLTHPQARIWRVEQLFRGTPLHNLAGTAVYGSALDFARLEAAINLFVRTHDATRIRIAPAQGPMGGARQWIAPHEPLRIRVTDFTHSESPHDAFRRWRDALAATPFALNGDPLIRVEFFRLTAQACGYFVNCHHLACDGWSIQLLAAFVSRAYLDPASLPDAPPYLELLEQEARYARSSRWEADRRFWLNELRDAPGYAVDRSGTTGVQRRLELPHAVADDMRRFAARLDVSIGTVAAALLFAYLHRGEHRDDLVVATPVSNRIGRRKQAFGMFVSTMPVRMKVDGRETFAAHARRLQATLARCYRHQQYPYDVLLRDRVAAGDGHDQLFRACFNIYRTDPTRAARIGDQAAIIDECYVGHQLFPLYLILKEWSAASIEIDLNYKPAIYSDAQVTALAELLTDGRAIAAAMNGATVDAITEGLGPAGFLAEPDRASVMTITSGRATSADPPQVAESIVASEAEQHQVRRGFNDTAQPFPSDTTIVRLFEQTVASDPRAIALRTERECWTYARVNERADRLSRTLRASGVTPGAIVPVLVERSPELVAAILGVLKAGGAYLPIDPTYPAARIAFLLEDAQAHLVLARSTTPSDLVQGRTIVPVDIELPADADGAGTIAGPTDLAYVCYTSGSTGTPKGVMIEHRSLVNRLHWMQRAYPLSGTDVLIQKTSISFDVSVWELFWWALAGASLALAGAGDEKRPDRLVDLVEHHSVSVIHFVPSMLEAFLQHVEEAGAIGRLQSLRHVFASGEALRPEHVARFNRVFAGNRTKLTNLYGPTEATVDVTYFDCPAGEPCDRVPIGKPIDNTILRILDADLRLRPIGVAGDLYIGGVGVARGYWRREELTRQRFVPDPYDAGGRLYRTGDRARWLPTGDVEFLGRDDDQVKLRGFRIELGEVESALRRHASVRDAAVVLRTSPGSGQLCGYVVLESPCSMDEIARDLSEQLPAYMVPTWLQAIDAIPLGHNGKVDRAALPAPSSGDERADAPPTALERELAAIWQTVLERPHVAIDDNFFALGGDSIRVLSLVSTTKARGHRIETEDVYRHPTVRALAQVVRTIGDERGALNPQPFELLGATDRERLPSSAEDAYPLSALQLGLIYQSQIARATPFYHDVFSYRIAGPFDEALFADTVAALCRAHPMLRTTFHLHGYSQPIQIVHRSVQTPLVVRDLRHLSSSEQERAIERDVSAIRGKVFDWERPGLVGFHIHRLGADAYVYTIDFHDSALDGWSVNAIHRELFETYYARLSGRTIEASAPAATFRDFVAVEQLALDTPAHKEFWAATLDGSTFIALPRWDHSAIDATDSRGRAASSHVAFHHVRLPERLTDAVTQVAHELRVPLKSVLMAAHVAVLSALSGDRDIVTGYEYGIRPEGQDTDRVIGLFLNTLPFRVRVDADSWRDLVRHVYQTEVELIPHRRYPMAQIKQDRRTRGPLFEHVFNFTHFHNLSGLARLPGFDLTEVNVRAETEFVFRAEFSVHSFTGDLVFWIHYHADAFAHAQIEAIGGYYANALQSIAHDPAARPSAQALLSREERHRQVFEFNARRRELPSVAFHRLFERQAASTPGAAAATCGSETWTFQQLNDAANTLAHALLDRTGGRPAVVAVMIERSLIWMAATIACFKAGCAYLPIDPAWPGERIGHILAQSDCRLALTADRAAADRLRQAAERSSNAPPLDVRAADAIPRAPTGHNPSLPVSMDGLAYIIFTSGSTGLPKGAMVEHAGMLNHLLAKVDDLGLTSHDVVAQTASASFDISLWQLLAPALVGGRVTIVPPASVGDIARCVEVLRRERVSILEVVPSYLAVLVEFLQHAHPPLDALRWLMVTGEAVPADLLERWFAGCPAVPVVNAYGPTEAADDICHHVMTKAPTSVGIPVGRPIQNMNVYVLDSALELVPVGAWGEVCVSGVGVGRGYVNDATRTAAAFVRDPFRPDERLYRTGDIGRWRPDGVLELAGRKDDQIKVRGYRVELGEVEARLRLCDGVTQAAVVADIQQGTLAAFVVTSRPVDAADLKRELAVKLPSYMVPARFVSVEALPLSTHGKVDKRALLQRLDGSDAPDAVPAPPVGATETELRRLWAGVLAMDEARIGRDSDFFELGGHSLKAMELSLRSHGRCTINDVMLHPVLRDLARRLDERQRDHTTDEMLVDYSRRITAPRLSLVGFTYAGGHAANFKPLFDALQAQRPDLACYGVESSHHTNTRIDVDHLAGICVDEIRASVRTPIVLWGHCSGAALTLAVARRLEADGVDVQLVVLGAKVIRNRPLATIHKLTRRAVSPFVAVDAAGMSPAQIKSWLIEKTGFDGFDALSDADGLVLTDAFRRDAVRAADYFDRIYADEAGPKIAAPVLNVVATDDPLTRGYTRKSGNWRLFAERVELGVLDGGGHYFIKTRPHDTAALLLTRLARLPSDRLSTGGRPSAAAVA